MFFYRRYKYSKAATAFSAVSALVAVVILVVGLNTFNASRSVGVICVILAIVIYIFCTYILSDKIARKDAEKNIKTDAKYCYMFVQEHPEAYDEMVSINKAFAAKYVRDELGVIVKRKNETK